MTWPEAIVRVAGVLGLFFVAFLVVVYVAILALNNRVHIEDASEPADSESGDS